MTANLIHKSFVDRKARTDNMAFAIAGIPCFADSFVQGGSSVLKLPAIATPRNVSWHLRQPTMSTEHYLKFLPEKDLIFEISKKVRTSLIEEHKLTRIIEILKDEPTILNETVKVINKGVRGPYSNGYYCGFVLEEEFEFWKTLVLKFPTNGLLNIIFAEHLVQKDKNYDRANQYYRNAFSIDFRLIGFIEPSWLDELTENNFEFRLVYLRLQKEQYEPEDFSDLIDILKNKYEDDSEKIKQIEIINAS